MSLSKRSGWTRKLEGHWFDSVRVLRFFSEYLRVVIGKTHPKQIESLQVWLDCVFSRVFRSHHRKNTAELVNRKVIVLTTFTTLGFSSEFLPRSSSEKCVRSCNSEGHTCSCIRISYRVPPSLNTINRLNAIDISIKIT